MRKLHILTLFLILVLVPVVHAARITSYDAKIIVDKNMVREDILAFVANRGESSIKLLLPPAIQNLKVNINEQAVECSQEEVVGITEVICPVEIHTDYFVELNFETNYPLISLTDRDLFSQEFNLQNNVDNFILRLKLPERAVLPEKYLQFVTPEPESIYSDGRRIVLHYEASDISKFEVSAIYESTKETSVLPILISVLLIISALLIIAKKVILAKRTEVHKHLLPDEREVINIIKNTKGPIRQRDIEKQIDFSKAKLSRMLRVLEERGIIKRIPRGNANLIELIK